jgi:hypothetical protein
MGSTVFAIHHSTVYHQSYISYFLAGVLPTGITVIQNE